MEYVRMVDYTKEIDFLLKRLFPITRSITGNGNRETLKILQEYIPLKIKEYPSGQQVYDWVIPKEWNINDAWIKDEKGKKLIDFKNSNLHVVSYSIPIHKKIKWEELKNHLFYLKDLPDAIPYRTSYYNENWGFCLSYNQFLELESKYEGKELEIFIDSTLENGSLTIGELIIEGKSKKEYLISTYICHPSMANDNLSGIITTTFLAKELLKMKNNLEYSYRIIFVPETIGAIAYCANNEKIMKNIKNGLVITTCGGPGKYGYKQSWEKENFINKMIEEVFEENNIDFITYPFDIHGSDERQYSSQGFRINCATITKDKYYEYKEYHTSLDNLDFVKAENLNRTLNLYLQLISKMDKNIVYKNLYPNCEVMLSKHNLYPKTGGGLIPNSKFSELDIILWSLFYMDGKLDLYEISRKLNISIENLYKYAKVLEIKGIIKKL
jgi:aminopeptidase-like protein